MPKLPDLSEITKKLDIQGLLDTVKSAVGGVGAPPKAPEGDEIAAKFVELITLTQNLATIHAEQAKAITNIHHKLNTLYKDIQAFQEAVSPNQQTTTAEKTPAIAEKTPAIEETKSEDKQ